MAKPSVRSVYSKKKHIELVPHCRFTLHLPTSSLLPDPASRRSKLAASAVINRVNKIYKGSTFSSVQHSSFEGFWLDDTTTPPKQYPTTLAVMFVDIVLDFNDRTKISHILDLLRRLSYVEYRRVKIDQKEIWITVSPVWIRMYVDNT